MNDWKVNLPRTAFPMKANLPTSEPETLARWDAMDLYTQIRQSRRGAPKFILHDGPPYANGQIHLGHVLNKTLKDIVVRSRTMAGFDAPYVPGWDCHGLPIEIQVDRELGPKKETMAIAEVRRACRQYAERFIESQRADFQRLGVLGDWFRPYRTMDFGYQAAIVRALGRFVAQGLVYKGKKPVHWCISCRTALAEAEVEYEPHVSPSIYVEFPVRPDARDELAARVPELTGRDVSALIWTTTPWTIPSNLGLAFHPDATYVAVEAQPGSRVVIVAETLVEQVASKIGRQLGPLVARFPGSRLEHLRFAHPLYDRASLGLLADYVALDQGTGVVHTAPGHGSDDFNSGVRYGLELSAPVGPGGEFARDLELFGGMRVFDANPRIEEALAQRGRLWFSERYEHAYPHCWRCKNPVIFLATSQWFIAMDGADLRQRALEGVKNVQWFPAWGEERISNMIANRPDWCISRQRSWGVPIPAVYCTNCRTPILTPELTERAATIFEREGADAWYERELSTFVPEDLACPQCGSRSFEREQDILDVWFDSGSSHEAVLAAREELAWPADLYVEGSDQYRGWFQSSLLIAQGTRNRFPFNQVLTHGFVVDEQNRKMSKSVGNFIEPQNLIDQHGAEILRLWVAMVDYREDVRIGKEILARTVEAYRKLRNTCRFLLGNLYDFDPDVDARPTESLDEVDRYALARFAHEAGRMLTAYERFEFHLVFHALNALTTVDLSAFYADVSKDRLYTLAARSPERRSAQTAFYLIADGMARLIAPILPVTAEDLWRHLPGRREESVHLAPFPAHLDRLEDPDLVSRWTRLLKNRDLVNAAIEEQRKDKRLGNSLEARVHLKARGDEARLLARYRDSLPMLFIVSEVTLDDAPPPLDGPDDVEVRVEPASGRKCERCWRYVIPPGSLPAQPDLCSRCQEVLEEMVQL